MSSAWLPPEQFLLTLPQFVMGTGVLVFDEDEQLLMLHDAPEPARTAAGYGARWLPPGGILEPGEGPLAAALRELYEETTLRITNLTVLGTVTYPPSNAWPTTVDHWFAAPALTRKQADSIRLSHEHDEWRFARVEHWDSHAAPTTLRLLDALLTARRENRTVTLLMDRPTA